VHHRAASLGSARTTLWKRSNPMGTETFLIAGAGIKTVYVPSGSRSQVGDIIG
jgi:hypothetical protein